jgi:hypothetical protein
LQNCRTSVPGTSWVRLAQIPSWSVSLFPGGTVAAPPWTADHPAHRGRSQS